MARALAATLQLGGGLFAAAAFGPTPASALTPTERFEAIRGAAATATLSKAGSSSLFSSKVGKLAPVSGAESFLFEAPQLCESTPSDAKTRYLSVRLWEPINDATAEMIVKSFEKKFAATEKRAEGFKIYYGSVVKDASGAEFALFANIFETADEADAINKKAVAFAAGELKGKAKLVDKVTGTTQRPASFYVCR